MSLWGRCGECYIDYGNCICLPINNSFYTTCLVCIKQTPESENTSGKDYIKIIIQTDLTMRISCEDLSHLFLVPFDKRLIVNYEFIDQKTFIPLEDFIEELKKAFIQLENTELLMYDMDEDVMNFHTSILYSTREKINVILENIGIKPISW